MEHSRDSETSDPTAGNAKPIDEPPAEPVILPPEKPIGNRRLTAAVIDIAVMIGIFSLLGEPITNGVGTVVQGLELGIAIAASFAYLILTEAIFSATLGKAITGLRVIRNGGGRVGIPRAVTRNFWRLWDLVSVIKNYKVPGYRRSGDLRAGTRVVRAGSASHQPGEGKNGPTRLSWIGQLASIAIMASLLGNSNCSCQLAACSVEHDYTVTTAEIEESLSAKINEPVTVQCPESNDAKSFTCTMKSQTYGELSVEVRPDENGGSEFTVPEAGDGVELAENIKHLFSESGLEPEQVECPRLLLMRPSAPQSCTAKLKDTEIVFAIKPTGDNHRFEIAEGPVYNTVALAEKATAVLGERGIQTTVDCGDKRVLIWSPEDTVQCSAPGKSGEAVPVSIILSDEMGQIAVETAAQTLPTSDKTE